MRGRRTPHEKWGEQVTAVIEPVPGAQIDTDALMAHARDILGSMKAPKAVFVMDVLPRSAVGKVLKREVRTVLSQDQNS